MEETIGLSNLLSTLARSLDHSATHLHTRQITLAASDGLIQLIPDCLTALSTRVSLV